MREEAEINRRLDEAMERYMRENRRQQNGAVSSVDDIRREILDLLMKYAGQDGVIPKNRIQSVLSELGSIESSVERRLEESLNESIEETIDKTIEWTVAAMGATLAAGIISVDAISRLVRGSVLNRTVPDGLTLRDRLFRISGSLVDNVRTVLRSGILRGKSVTSLNREVKQAFEGNEWVVRRLIMTEGNNTYRRTIGQIAIDSGVVRAVRIIDNRGRHPNHENHRCYILAEQDMYGWGKGVYRPQDAFIYYPHPNCTAYYRFILIGDERQGGRR